MAPGPPPRTLGALGRGGRARFERGRRGLQGSGRRLFEADGAVELGDRQHLRGFYRGIAFGADLGFDNIVAGDLFIVQSVAGDLHIVQSTEGDLHIVQSVEGDLHV